MLTHDLTTLFRRDLARLHQEIEAYGDEASLWGLAEGIRNSAGNLCLHLVGNLQAFIGAALGRTGYVRNREAEFATQHVPQAQLLRDIGDTSRMVERTLDSLTDARLQELYPLEVLGYPMTTLFFVIHLHGHLTYHLGQIDYHRRILAKGQAIRFVN